MANTYSGTPWTNTFLDGRDMHFILGGKNGKTPVRCDDIKEWSRWFNQAERQVGFDKVGDIQVSTVFLGIALDFAGRHPILFETMIIGEGHNHEPERYTSWESAAAGHALWVGKIKQKLFMLELSSEQYPAS